MFMHLVVDRKQDFLFFIYFTFDLAIKLEKYCSIEFKDAFTAAMLRSLHYSYFASIHNDRWPLITNEI